MKKTKLLSFILATVLLTGCAVNQASVDKKDSSKQETSEAQSVSTPVSSEQGGDTSEQQGNSRSEQTSSSQNGASETSAPIEHTHSWSSSWTSDPDYHWHKCDGCAEIKDKAAHTWDAGKVTKEPGAYTTGTKTFTCTICNRTKTEDIPATGGGETVGAFTFNDSELNTPQEIHTADQKKYLNLGIQYYNITASDLTSCNASGNANKSAPQKVKISWNYTAPSGKTVSKFQLLYGQRSDLGDAYTIEGTTANSVSFYNPYLGDNYFKVIANFSDGTKEASEIKVFKVTTQAPRNLYAGNMPNVRDMGGRVTYAGGKIKQGLIYRGAGNKFDNSSQVDNDCKNTLLQQLKIKTEINVANSTTNNINLTGVTVKNAYMD